MSDGCKIYREACPDHGFYHGAEAEELREGIEKIIKTCRPCVSTAEDGCTGCHIVEELELLLDRVDARDSLAYREKRRSPRKRRPA